ncbi:MAG TPA: molybdopterin-synthase adenylyltransferase MoeB [Anaeromyxobacteraceae bacterium]|nr:molybdopterin-synthase adenylyltransferase MoeB [Anaeromyxobacteraceae bacterium]
MADTLPPLDADEVERYGRHLALPEFGLEGQRRLKAARVLLVGAGGLGSPAALYLAAAGVGHISVVDFDAVEATNLQRQVLHGTRDVGHPKVESARRRLLDLNPHVSLSVHQARFSAANALPLVRDHDLVVDGTDNFTTRYLVNDACVLAGRPNVHASVFRFEGQASVFATASGPCYRCLYPTPPPPGLVPSCAEGGVLGVLPGLLGTVQATEAIKLAAGIGRPLIGRLLLVDALSMEFRTMSIRRDPRCPACGTREIRELRDEPVACAAPQRVPEIAPAELEARLRRGDPFTLLDVREDDEWARGSIPGARPAPLSRLAEEVRALDRGRDVVVYCQAGVRSQEAGARLRAAGFAHVLSLAGGFLRYRAEVDPSLPGA